MVKRYTKNPVGAHYGVRDWLLQRLTAVVMAGYTIFVILAMVLRMAWPRFD
jgi:succinate dehydrogenase / fumarate reductase membrane anchor subunit